MRIYKPAVVCQFLSALLVVCSGLSCGVRKDDRSSSSHYFDRPRTLMQIWEKQSSEHNIDEDVIRKVENLFYEIVKPYESRKMQPEPVQESLDRYLAQFKHLFQINTMRSQACYTTAWLLVQCEKREPPTAQQRRQTRVWLDEFKKKVNQKVDEIIVSEMGREGYQKYNEQVEQIHTQTANKLDAYFNEFYSDPLFPLFKNPISTGVENKLLKVVKEHSHFELSFKPEKEQSFSEEKYVFKQMKKAFDHIPEEIILYGIQYTNRNEWEKSEYWDGLLHYLSGAEGDWPVRLLLRKRSSGFTMI